MAKCISCGREIPETGDFIIIRNAEDREAFL